MAKNSIKCALIVQSAACFALSEDGIASTSSVKDGLQDGLCSLNCGLNWALQCGKEKGGL